MQPSSKPRLRGHAVWCGVVSTTMAEGKHQGCIQAESNSHLQECIPNEAQQQLGAQTSTLPRPQGREE